VDRKYVEARILLAEMRIREETPKLDALCRWVRDLDIVNGLSAYGNGIGTGIDRTAKDQEPLVVLDAILRVTGPIDTHSADSARSTNPIALQGAWNANDGRCLDLRDTFADPPNSEIPTFNSSDVIENFWMIDYTPASLRKPPNKHTAILHACTENTILLSSESPEAIVQHHPVVPNLSMILHVLSPAECIKIIPAAESIDF
jgi:hypothetical protein